MDINGKKIDHKIGFILQKDDPEIDDKLSFVHLVKMRFEGEVDICRWFHHESNDPYIEIVLAFPDWSATDDALSHCNQSLDRDGSVVASYKGALEYADPRHVMAHELKDKALNNRYTEVV